MASVGLSVVEHVRRKFDGLSKNLHFAFPVEWNFTFKLELVAVTYWITIMLHSISHGQSLAYRSRVNVKISLKGLVRSYSFSGWQCDAAAAMWQCKCRVLAKNSFIVCGVVGVVMYKCRSHFGDQFVTNKAIYAWICHGGKRIHRECEREITGSLSLSHFQCIAAHKFVIDFFFLSTRIKVRNSFAF